jgi:hypothetical protein
MPQEMQSAKEVVEMMCGRVVERVQEGCNRIEAGEMVHALGWLAGGVVHCPIQAE